MNAGFCLRASAAALGIAACLISAGSTAAAVMSDDALYAGADARIEKHRKAPAVVSVVDAAGKPVAGAEVVVEQVRHALLFGLNIFNWGRCSDETMEAAYLARFGGRWLKEESPKCLQGLCVGRPGPA